MRVLHVNKYFFLQGGAERAYLAFDRLLREAGHETIHLAMAGRDALPSPWSGYFLPEVRHDRSVWHPESWKAAARTLGAGTRPAVRRLLRDARPDVAVVHNAYHQLGLPALLSELAAHGVPIIHVLHDWKPLCPAHVLHRGGRICESCAHGRFWNAALHGCGGSRARGVLLALEGPLLRRRYAHVRIFTAPSRFMIEKAGEMGFPHPIRLLRNPVEVPDDDAAPADGAAVGFAGRLSGEKGLDVLLRAATALPHIPFRIAGAGPLAAELERTRPANVTLLGQLAAAQLRAEMRTWRAAVVPSVLYENCPYAVLEAFALGVPVVGSDLGGIRELLPGRGLLFPPGDAAALAGAVRTLGQDPDRARSLGAAGLALVKAEFSPERCKSALGSLLDEAIA